MGNKSFSIKDISKFNRKLGPREKIICLLGETGNGKSTFINQITKKEECKEGDDAEAVTTEPKMVNLDYEGYNFYFIDTPGLNDKKGDDENIKQLNELRKCPRINAFILLLKFNDLRITESIQRSLIEFMKIFPSKNFWNNIIIVRNWSFKDTRRGKILEGIKKDDKLNEFMKSNNINVPNELKEFYIDLKSDESKKYELLRQILNELKKIHPIYKDVIVTEEERFEENENEILEYYILKTTTYIDFDDQRRTFTEKNMIMVYNYDQIKPTLVTVKREKTNVVQSDCCCKKYKYEYNLILTYEMKGKKYTKKTLIIATFEDEDNNVNGEAYRKQLEEETNKLYLKLE